MIDKITDRLVRMRLEEDEHKLFVTRITFSIIGGLLLINVIILNYIFFTRVNDGSSQQVIVKASPTKIESTSTPPPVNISVTATLAPQNQTAVTSIPQEFFIPLGSGISQAADWTNVPGAQAIIDFGQYPSMDKAIFEASIYIPNANQFVMVRLFNVSDNNPVWNSEMILNSGSSGLLTSQALGVAAGSKTYQVQMKTQLQAQADLVQSRIRILTD